MPNHGQLEILTTAQHTAIATANGAGQLKVAELVKVYWPSPDGVKVYSWWNCLADSAYTSPLTTWLAGAPLVPAFVAGLPAERFHNIPRTSAIGDDVIQMRFSNYGQVFETLCYTHRGGVKVEVFYYFPEIEGGTAVSWFLGHLRTPDSCDRDWVNVSVANAFRSPNLLLPNRAHASNCGFYFGGELTAAELVGHPCDYDRHVSGTRGTLDGASPWTFCEHTKEACERILGDLESYGGDDTVIESTLIGRGEHKTVSTTVGNETRLKDPIRVIYGERRVRDLFLLSYAKEYHPDEDHQDLGTLRTLFEVSEGSVQAINNVKVMDRDLPRPDGLGLEVRLGTQRQSPTTYSPSVLNYNRRAHFRGDLNPFDPNGVKASDIRAECDVIGRDDIRIYSDESTYSTAYTNLRAWCLLDLLTNQWYGHRMDKSRFLMSDFIYLAGKGSTFNADVQGNRTVQQHVYDLCLAGGIYLPFNYNGKTRILPIEDVDLTLSDIPVFTDVNPGGNILCVPPEEGGFSRLTVSYKDDDLIPNSIILTIEDADHDNIERPLTFEDWQQQYRAGLLYGDKSKRKVEGQYAAFGLTHVDDVRPLGELLLQIGPFGQGGIINNCAVEFAVDAFDADALNLHENKVIKVVSSKLTPYTDENGDIFQYFLITSLYRNSKAELIIKAQAWGRVYWEGLCQPIETCEDVVWECMTFMEASGSDLSISAGGTNGRVVCHAQSEQLITQAGEYFTWRMDPQNEVYVGLSYNDCPACTPHYNPFPTIDYCFFDRDNSFFQFATDLQTFPETVGHYYANEDFVSYSDDDYTVDTVFKLLRNDDDKIEYYVDDVLVYTSTATVSGDLRLDCVTGPDSQMSSFPFLQVMDATFCGLSEATVSASGYVRWNTPDDDVIDGPNGVDTQVLSVSADRAGDGDIYPDTIDEADITLSRWTHTVVAMPTSPDSYNIWHNSPQLGFKVWHDGSGWIYHGSGIDTTTITAGTVQVGDTLSVEYNDNGGSPVRYYKHNGSLLHTDSGGGIVPVQAIQGVCITTGDTIGAVFWELEYNGCQSNFQVSPVGQGGTSGTSGSSSTSSSFDVLLWQVHERPEPYIQVEVFN